MADSKHIDHANISIQRSRSDSSASDEKIETEDIQGVNHSDDHITPQPEPEPEKPKRKELTPSDFLFGGTLGEGAYARVVHAQMKSPNTREYAIKIMEKSHIKKENKVC